ncbi:MAG: secondary thiamine-phosphate synthase enzyme YjbQ [Thermogemmata sp.]|nr:secondary thiamine-phosphate synthase enzyme YjbQ [Thermogemmata sp.]
MVTRHVLDVTSHRRTEMIDITAAIQDLLRNSALRNGLCVVYCPHTTAAVTIQEHADPDVAHDLLLWLNQTVPQHLPGYRHGEGNSDAHIKSALVGPSVTVLVQEGKLLLGTWQGIFFCEFDGPRRRQIWVQLLGQPDQP